MGLFSRKKTVLSATTASMVTDSPDIVQQSVLTSIAHGSDITSDLIANLQAGLASSIQRYYSAAKYQKEKNGVDLFPVSHRTQYSTKVLDIESALLSIHGETVTLINYTYQPLDTDMVAYEYMTNTYGFNIKDYSFQTSPSGYPASQTTFSNSALSNGTLIIEYGNTQNDDIYRETTNVTGLKTADVYYHVMYTKVSQKNKYLFWNYRVASNEYPFLTQNEFQKEEGYFPVVPIIEYSQDMTHEDKEDTPQYEASRLLLHTIGLNFKNVHDSLAKSENYGAIEQAHFSCSVRLRDDDPLALKYMFNMFKTLEAKQSYDKAYFDAWVNQGAEYMPPPMSSLNYRMSAFKTDLKWMYVESKVVSKAWTHGDEDYARFHVVKSKEAITYTDEDGDTINAGQTYDPSTITFVRKIDANNQEEVTIVGMSQINYIDNKYSKEWDVQDMFDDSEEGQDPVTFLVQPDIVRAIFPALVERNTFYYRTYTLILNFKEVVKLKWYQTGFFQFLLVIVAIVITVWSVGTLAESLVLAYGAAGGGVAGAGAVLWEAIMIAGYAAAADWVLQELLAKFGWEALAIIAVLLVAVVSTSSTMKNMVMPDTMSVTQFVGDIFKSFGDFFKESSQDLMAEAMADLEEYREWKEDYDTMYEDMFGLGDSFASVYAEYTKDQSIYNTFTADEYMFIAMDMLLMTPVIVTGATETFIDTALSVDT
ncbi:TMhelix containing protein [Vibrio phage 1.261.O._10N.286.51.A7]|uniref:TMhelix containing protein n=1 Tax=Vibrio phage 1.261.O._10N.286.51.A7 TaxID=1881237 RepID=A0A2I7RZG4_9CAUD|nr:TMhelix containing protein [Vibrio phage 1.261.O._10N.286.51.A7]AUR99052.1 TMhelix containing protein [Vibrio phage 1.261.O._10N.286.51.A7]